MKSLLGNPSVRMATKRLWKCSIHSNYSIPAPAPDKPLLADVGTDVAAGKVVCIIEAMKLLNEIEADATGTIKKILVENGQPVEYGETLFIIG